MDPKILVLLEKLKNNFSTKLLDEVMDVWENEMVENDLSAKGTDAKLLLNSQDNRFYEALAESFTKDLNSAPEIYFLTWEEVLDLFKQNIKIIFLEYAVEQAKDTDAFFYAKGMIALDKGNVETALFYFNEIDDYLTCYFLGICYLEMGNFENAIKQNLFFFENWNERLRLSSNEEDDLTTTNGNLIASWNIYNDLGYLYNRIFEYETAKSYYEKLLALTSLEDNFIIRFPIEHEGINDFDVFISNYLFCLEKTKDYAKCVEVLEFVTSKLPDNIYYSKQKLRFEEKIKQIGLGEEIIKQASPRKTPFNIAKFSPTKILAREKALEEMIIEQIKYGFKVFGKALELYVSSSIYGRQFAIPGINGILDLLLIDKASDMLYVVELKRNEAGIEVVEQIERYMEGLTKHLKQKVKGIISLHKPDEELKLMVRSKPEIELFTYHFDFKQEE